MTSIPIQRVPAALVERTASAGDARRPESRTSGASAASSVQIPAPSEQADVVHGALHALVQDVNKTAEVIRKHHEQQLLDKRTFQGEMEVSGKISVEPQESWLQMRLKSVSTEDMRRELSKVKDDQRQNAVSDTLAALVYDVNATAEVLRQGLAKQRKRPKVQEEVEYRLRLTPAPDDDAIYHQDELKTPDDEADAYTVETVKKDYGVELSESQMSSLKRRARSATPRRTLNIEPAGPRPDLPICAYCNEPIEGPVLTALAPNAEHAQRFHPHHFMCCYCLKTLNLRGTFREHERRPYCHECFYKLWNGLIYEPDNNQRIIEKLI